MMSYYEYFLIFLALVFCAICELYRPEDTEDSQLLFARASICRDAESADGMVSRHDNTAVYLRTLLRKRAYRLCLLLVRYFLTRGLQTLLGTLFNLSAIAFQKPERCFKFFTLDTCTQYYYSVLDRTIGLPTFQVCVNAE